MFNPDKSWTKDSLAGKKRELETELLRVRQIFHDQKIKVIHLEETSEHNDFLQHYGNQIIELEYSLELIDKLISFSK